MILLDQFTNERYVHALSRTILEKTQLFYVQRHGKYWLGKLHFGKERNKGKYNDVIISIIPVDETALNRLLKAQEVEKFKSWFCSQDVDNHGVVYLPRSLAELDERKEKLAMKALAGLNENSAMFNLVLKGKQNEVRILQTAEVSGLLVEKRKKCMGNWTEISERSLRRLISGDMAASLDEQLFIYRLMTGI